MLRATSNGLPLSAPTIRVASVPSSHVYVRHLSVAEPHDPAVVRLPDPRPSGSVPAGAEWWPPSMLDARWAADHVDDFDVSHLHFGFDTRSPQQLLELVVTLRETGKPLVFTVHDLRNPHHHDRRRHDDQLDVLVPAADALLTLTEGAAAEVLRRWGRVPWVVPHPHVVDLGTAARLRAERAGRSEPFRVGLHVKSVRASMDPAAVLPVLARAVAQLPDAVLQVNGHPDVLDRHGERHDRRLTDALDRVVADLGPRVDVRVHEYMTDDEMWTYLAGLDVSVLPYRHGTHSGWLEACRDLGTQVIAPTCGFYADQGPVHSFDLDEEHLDEDSLVRAICAAHDAPHADVSLDARQLERQDVDRVHRDLYARLLSS